MPFIGLEHFDAFGALSPCFTGAFWIWYTRPKWNLPPLDLTGKK